MSSNTNLPPNVNLGRRRSSEVGYGGLSRRAPQGAPIPALFSFASPSRTSVRTSITPDPITPVRSRFTTAAPQPPSPIREEGEHDGSEAPEETDPTQVPLPAEPEELGPEMFANAFRDLTTVLSNLGRSGAPKENRTKIREPDTFDGTDPLKLRPFLTQLAVNFADRSSAFQNDEQKVIYSISFLRGMALEWFEPDILEVDEDNIPAWGSDFTAFVQELQINFGPHDPVASAETNIENLRMRDTDRISKYIVRFNQNAVRIGWGDAALRHQFYKGLPGRIKDEISRVGKPDSLPALRNLAQNIDARYWTRRDEVARENSSRNAAPTRTSDSTSGNQSGGKKPSSNTSSSSGSKNQSTSSSSSKSSSPKPYADKLGKDGKLTPAERARRIKEKLCMFCGGSGHIASECKKRPTPDAKARAATATPAKAAESDADSKK